MTDWQRDDSGLSVREIERRPPYKLEPHSFRASKKLPWQRCQNCGLLTLRNDLTAWCIKVGCNAADHPEYAARCRAARGRS